MAWAQVRNFRHAGQAGWGYRTGHTIRVVLADTAGEWKVIATEDDMASAWREAEKMFRRLAEERNRDLELI